jgi:hypothetical protein
VGQPLRPLRLRIVWRSSLSQARAECFSRFLILLPEGDKPSPRLIMEI